ncbi:MAG: MFS transporter, partial [archaeon]|nr:MFS transporter [archaeon]
HYLFFVAIIIITIGEMIIAPFGRSLVAKFASEDKRGRYMAVFGLSWGFPNLFGVVVAGYIMDYLNPVWIWYFAGILCIISTGGFFYLNKRVNENKVLESIEE